MGSKECKVCMEMNTVLSKKDPDKTYHLTKTGAILLGVCATTFTAVYAVTLPFILPALRRICLPYVPATTNQVRNVVKMLEGRSGSVLDVGSGDGRIAIEVAKHGYNSSGVELNPWLVWYSRYAAWRNGVHQNTHFIRKDLWQVDFSKYDNIIIFGVQEMMEPLESKLLKELSKEGVVISCRFPLATWQPVSTIEAGIDTVWLYNNKSNNVNQEV